MTTRATPKPDLSLLWGSGYAIVICQWLANGSFGSSWLPALSNLGPFAALGPAALWSFFTISLIFLIVFYRTTHIPINEKTALLASSAVALMVGDFVVFFVGYGILDAWLYPIGMACIGIGVSVLALGWGQYYCLVGEKLACINLSLCFVLGSCLFFLISFVGQQNFIGATLIQLAIIPVCGLTMHKAWKVQSGQHATWAGWIAQAPHLLPTLTISKGSPIKLRFPITQLAPYFSTVFVFGFFLGMVTGFSVTQDIEASPFVGAFAMGAMGTLLFGITVAFRSFSLMRISRGLIPLLIVFALLYPMLSQNYSDIVFILLYSGYVYARVFYTLTYVSLARTKRIPMLPLIACAIATDAFGVVIGEVFCIMVLGGEFAPPTIYIITSVVIVLILVAGSLFMREQNLMSLWGLKKLDYTDEAIEKKCLAIVDEFNLTFRETELLTRLAKGITAEAIAKDLDISVATVRTHTRNIYAKMDIHSQPELIRTIVFSSNQSQ